MDFEKYLLFVGASIVLCIVPGPDMILLLSRSITQGRRAGLMTAFGINLGAYFHLFAAIAGISAILTTSAYAFTAIKWAGATYLLYLGITVLRSKSRPLQIDAESIKGRSGWSSFWQGFWSDVLNPKVAIFYLAFLPQFITPGPRHLSQLLVLGVTANLIGIISSIIIVCLSAKVTATLRQDPRVSMWLAKGLGAIFVALGIRLAGEKAL
jgi:threonine/homoserine/homoserine lactone efflux protein